MYQQGMDDYIASDAKHNIPVGDPISILDDESTRVYFQNINGLGQDQLQWPTIIQQLHANKVSIFGLAETNVYWTRTIYDKCKSQLKCLEDFNTLTTSNSTVKPLQGNYQPGGTALAVWGRWTGRCERNEQDPTGMGRWTQTTIRGKEGTAITFFAAYRVNDGKASAGIHTAWSQQELLMREAGQVKANPRQAILQDMGKLVNEEIEKGRGVVVMMDANEPFLNGRSKATAIAEWASKHQLVDVHFHMHPEEIQTATYSRGRTKIDHILVSRELLPFITSAGMVAFNQIIQSDHRGLFLDIKLASYLRGDIAIMEARSARRLNSKRPKDALKYQTELAKSIAKMNAIDRLEAIEKTAIEDRSSEWWKLVVQLDEEITAAMECAEAQIKQRTLPFSDQLIQANLRFMYWSTAKMAKKTKRDMHQQLAKWAAKIKADRPDPSTPCTLSTVMKELRKASKALRKVKRNAAEIRQQFLRERAEAAAIENNQPAEQALASIIRAEQSRETYAAIKRYMKNNTKQGLTHLLVPKNMEPDDYPYQPEEVTEWTVIQDEADIGRYLRARNIKHFGQAQGTPFTEEPLKSAIRPTADTPMVDQILKGEIPASLAELDEMTKIFLAECKKKAPTISLELDVATCIAAFRQWRESTATYGNRHLGHYRALGAATGIEKTDEEQETTGESIMGVHVRIMNLAIQHGEPLPRWLQALNIILPKIPGKPFLHKLRIIHLFEADYQFILKELAFRLNQHNEHLGLLGDQQYGSRPGRSAAQLLFATSLTMDYINSTRTNAGIANMDAQACYDRMIPAAVGLVDRTYGCPKAMTTLHGKALARMEYRIKTAAGVSATTRYTSTNKAQLYGNGQGACDSPVQWGFQSTIKGNVMIKHANGFKMSDPKHAKQVRRVISLFVDDSDIFANGTQRNITLADLLERLRKDSQLWAALLRISGGRLELTKCFFTAVVWLFNEWGTPYPMLVNEMGDPHTELTQGSESVALAIQESTQGYKTLGQYHAMVGIPAEEKSRLATKVDQAVRKLYHHGLTRSQAHIAYHRVFGPGITYAIGTTPLRPADLEDVQRPATNAFLPALGLNRNTPRALVYGPLEFGGLGFIDLPTEAGVEAIALAIMHLRSSTSTEGQMLRIALRNRQLEAGTRRLLLEDPSQAIPYLAPGWIVNAREFLAKTDHILQIPTETEQPIQRRNDRFIMDEVLKNISCSAQLTRINACRLFLRVTRLSEIVTADGLRLDEAYLTAAALPRTNRLEWPQQGRPGKMAWRLFRRTMETIFAKPLYTSTNQVLKEPLGQWLIRCDELDQHWEAAYDPETNHLYQRNEKGWTQHKGLPVTRSTRQSRRTTSPRLWFSCQSVQYGESLPQKCIPTTAIRKGNHYESLPLRGEWRPPQPAMNSKPSYKNFQAYLRESPGWDQTLRRHVTVFATDAELETKLRGTTAFTHCSDGGVSEGLGSFGWILAASDNIIAHCRGPAYGDSELMHSFRAEGYGGISATQFIIHAVQYFAIPKANRVFQWKWTCDNLGLIKRLTKLQSTLPTTGLNLRADSDVCQQLLHNLEEIPNRQIKHVKGHQDRSGAILSLDEQLNVLADEQATKYYKDELQNSSASDRHRALDILETVPAMPNSGAQLISRHDPNHPRAITSKIREHLRQAALTPALREYMIRKYRWETSTPEKVNWLAYAKSQKHTKWGQQAAIVKLANRWAATGTELKKRNPLESDQCSACQLKEDSNHVLTCASRRKLQVAYLCKLHQICVTFRVQETIESAITQGLRRFLQLRVEPILNTSLELAKAIAQQEEIGWDRFVYGHTSGEWMDLQNQHERTLPPLKHPRKPEQWVIQVILLSWEFIRESWHDRNDAKHGKEEAKVALMQKSLRTQIEQVYDQKARVSQQSQRFFEATIDEKAAEPPYQIKAWLRHVTRLIRAEEESELQRSKAGNQDIRQYFAPREITREGIG